VSAWADGVVGWTDGASNPFPGNEDMWAQINLSRAQGVATNLGQGIVVAVIDTGVDLYHGGLAGRLTDSGSWLDLVDGNAYPHESADVMAMGPYFGHGTAASGIILQAAPNATIMPIRVLSAEGFGSATDLAIAIDHAIAHGGPRRRRAGHRRRLGRRPRPDVVVLDLRFGARDAGAG
jgi:thermitase